MVDKKHGKRHFGVKQLKPKHFEKAFNTTGKILDVGGEGLLMAGATNPELLPLGATAIEAGIGAKKISKILKKSRKKKKSKK